MYDTVLEKQRPNVFSAVLSGYGTLLGSSRTRRWV